MEQVFGRIGKEVDRGRHVEEDAADEEAVGVVREAAVEEDDGDGGDVTSEDTVDEDVEKDIDGDGMVDADREKGFKSGDCESLVEPSGISYRVFILRTLRMSVENPYICGTQQ